MPDPRRCPKKLDRFTIYLGTPRTIPEIMRRLGVSQRSAYRWLGYLEAHTGVPVQGIRRKGKIKYSLG